MGGGRRSTPTRSITTRQGWRDPNTTASAYHAQGTCLISRDKIGTCPERPAWACARCEKKKSHISSVRLGQGARFFFLFTRTDHPPLSACHAPEHCAYLNSESPTVLQEAISYEPIFFGQHVSSHVFQRWLKWPSRRPQRQSSPAVCVQIGDVGWISSGCIAPRVTTSHDASSPAWRPIAVPRIAIAFPSCRQSSHEQSPYLGADA